MIEEVDGLNPPTSSKTSLMKFYFFFVPLLAIGGCASDGSSEKEAPLTARLECETRIDETTGSPFSEVYLLVEEQKIKVADIGACDPFTQTDYATYQIPDTALAACGGWWAGAGDYVYVVRHENALRVFQGWRDELQEDEGFHYEEIYSWKGK